MQDLFDVGKSGVLEWLQFVPAVWDWLEGGMG